MDYLVAGWNTYHFLLSPDKLQKILSEYHLVIFQEHVRIGYTESDLKEYLSAYRALYDLLLSGKQINCTKDHSFFLSQGITSDLTNCTYGKRHRYQGNEYQLTDFKEPVVGIAPTALWIGIEDKKLYCSTAYSRIAYSEYYMGVQLQYPKMIQYRIDGEYEVLRPTSTLKSYQDYEELKKAIKQESHYLTIKTTDGIMKRTNLLIDDETKARLNACYIFQTLGITVK